MKNRGKVKEKENNKNKIPSAEKGLPTGSGKGSKKEKTNNRSKKPGWKIGENKKTEDSLRKHPSKKQKSSISVVSLSALIRGRGGEKKLTRVGKEHQSGHP